MAYAAVLEAFKMAEKQSGTYREALKLRAQREAEKAVKSVVKDTSQGEIGKEIAGRR
ncbi:hypothetical protein [Bosea massiliensis]|uniref:Uncharacterized protein n=1 Tax=Bosea massiliensis TaxID=151419 RepID=A0ABW0PAR7_9HYPH